MNKICGVLLASMLLSFPLSGCFSKPSSGTQGDSSQPVTLTMTSFSTSTNEQEFEAFMQPFVQKKFPNVILKWIQPDKNQNLTKMISSDQPPDIVVTGYSHIPELLPLELPLDLNQLVKKYRLDLNQFNPTALQSVKIYGQHGELFALPYTINYYALFYNKDIFDKFGVAYPKNSMTWDDTLSLAKKVTDDRDGTHYVGLGISDTTLLGRGLSLSLVDPKQDQAVLGTDQWAEVVNLDKEILGLSNSQTVQTNGINAFINGTIAMYPFFGQGSILSLESAFEGGKSLNWDMTTFPHFSESPGKTMEISTNIYVVSKASKHPDAAFQVISYLATDPEVQTKEAQSGNLPAIKMGNFNEVFGEDVPVLKGKNFAGVFQDSSREDHMPSLYDQIAMAAFRTDFQKYYTSDTRTFLRALEDDVNKQIVAAKEQQ